MQINRVGTCCRVYQPQPHRVIADWLGLMEPARHESCPSGQRRIPAAPREDNLQSQGKQQFFYIYDTNNQGTKKQFARDDTPPQIVETPPPLGYD